MKILILLTFITISNFLSAKAYIINGKETLEHAPVVKLSMNSDYGIKMGTKGGTCTGTFFKAGFIITAAHCIKDIYLERRLSAVDYITRGNSIPEILQAKIFINDEKVSRVQEMFLSDISRLAYDQKFMPYNILDDLEEKVSRDEISTEQFHKELRSYRKAYQAIKGQESQSDIAILKVSPLETDQVYSINYDGLSLKDPVSIVGFGLSINPIAARSTESQIYAYQNLADDGVRARKYKKQVDKLSHYLNSAVGVKKMGQNEVEVIFDGLVYLKALTIDMPKRGLRDYNNYNPEKVSSISSGDSGGPLLSYSSDKFSIKAIASSVIVKVDENSQMMKPVYIDVSSVRSRDFIEGVVSGKRIADL